MFFVLKQLQQYMKEVREISGDYKSKKQTLADAQNEIQTLRNTLEEIKVREEQLHNELLSIENEKGLIGFFSQRKRNDNQETPLNEISSDEEMTDHEVSEGDLEQRIRQTNEEIDLHKAKLTELVQQVKPKRREHLELKQRHEEQKTAYDAVAAGLELRVNQMQTDNLNKSRQIREQESSQFRLDCEIRLLRSKLEWLKNETNSDNEHPVM